MSLSPSDLGRALSTAPLMGRGLAEAASLVAALDTALAAQPDPRLLLVLHMARARIGLVGGEAGAVSELVAAEAIAVALGDRVAGLQLQLLGYRALGDRGMAAAGAELLDAIEEECLSIEALGADWRLARAACGHPDARRLWLEAVALLPTPERDHDRFAAWLGAAHASTEGGDVQAARRFFDQALGLARAHVDERAEGQVCFHLANLLLGMGLPAEAKEHLARSVAVAGTLGDDLTLIAHGSVLAALALHTGDWEAAAALGETISTAARRRSAWIGVADGALVIATALAAVGRVGEGLHRLTDTARELSAEQASAAVNIIKARLGELRFELGAESFDAALAWKPASPDLS